MVDEPTGTQAGDTPGDDKTTQQPTGGQPQAGKTYTQEEFDRSAAAIRREADKKATTEKQRADGLAQKVADFEASQLSEAEKLQRERDDAKAENDRLRYETETLRVGQLRANIVLRDAATLPAVYRERVTGNTEDEITASIATLKSQHATDLKAAHTDFLRAVASMTPEQIKEQFGDEGAALADRLAQKPASLGGTSSLPGNVPETDKPTDYDSEGGVGQFLAFINKPPK